MNKTDNVYVYIFEETNAVYVGRTVNPKRRNYQHHTDIVKNSKQKYCYNTAVYNYAVEHNLDVPQMKILESELSVKDGLIKEEYWVNYYKNKGYEILNRYPCGLFCGADDGMYEDRYSDENLKELGEQFESLDEFKVKCPNRYDILKERNLLEKLNLPLHPNLKHSNFESTDGRDFSQLAKRLNKIFRLETDI